MGPIASVFRYNRPSQQLRESLHLEGAQFTLVRKEAGMVRWNHVYAALGCFINADYKVLAGDDHARPGV
jgi:hypothetical protein